MASGLKSTIEEIQALYKGRTGDDTEAEFGNMAKAMNADTPRIVWTLGNGSLGLRDTLNGPRIVTINVLIWLWYDGLDAAWEAASALADTILDTVYVQESTSADFQVPTEVEGRNMDKGDCVILSMAIRIELGGPSDSTEPAPPPYQGAQLELGTGNVDGVVDDLLEVDTAVPSQQA